MFADKKIISKKDLTQKYDFLLQQALTKEEYCLFKKTKTFPERFIVQTSSGSSGLEPLRIPRTLPDIKDIFARISQPFINIYQSLPQRIALLGGASHAETALKFQIGTTKIQTFTIDQWEALKEFNPDFISCYPSIIREIIQGAKNHLPQVQAIKLGGEKIYPSDLEKIWQQYPQIPVIEQIGSTEMPALAIGCYKPGESSTGAVLQSQRFSFLLTETSDWQPLIVKDDFLDLAFRWDEFYDTGDEVRVQNQQILEIQRREDPANLYYPKVDQILKQGYFNIQIDRQQKAIYHNSKTALPDKLSLCNESYVFQKRHLKRLKDSNKLPLLFS